MGLLVLFAFFHASGVLGLWLVSMQTARALEIAIADLDRAQAELAILKDNKQPGGALRLGSLDR